MLMSVSPGRAAAMVPAPAEGRQLRGHRQRSPNSAAPTVGINVELSLPIFRLALAVFIPWRGADGFDRRAAWRPR